MTQIVLSLLFMLMAAFPWAASANRTIPQTVAIEDILLLEEIDRVVQVRSGGSGTTVTPGIVRVYSNYVPIAFQNNTGLSASDVYLTFQGIDPSNATAQQQFIQFASNGQGSFVPSSSTLLSANYSIPLSQLPPLQGFPGTYLLYIPLTISGRAYVTINQPMFLPVSSTAPYAVLDPQVTNYTDPNYYTLYDKWEFTFITSGQSGSNLAWQGNLNSSGVDFFGLSSELKFLSYPSGQLLQTFDSTQVNDGPTTFSQARQTLIDTFVNGLTTTNNSAAWSLLCLPFYSDPYSGTGVTTYLRILNPGFSIQNPPTTYASGGSVMFPQNPSDGFPSAYLSSNTYGGGTENYVNEWFLYYNMTGNTLTIDQDVLANPFTYSGTSSGSSGSQTLTLTASGEPTETMTEMDLSADSKVFFTGAGFPFSPSNSILSEYIGGTFEVGLFNFMTMPTISQTNLRSNHASYYNNPPFMSTPGPWYDLYAKLLHSEGLVPSYSVTGIGAVYASPYDDLLGINSSIAVKNPTDYTTTPNPYVNITLNGITNVPSIADSGSYMVTFDLQAGGSISYREGSSGSYTPIASMTPFTVNSFPLQVAYVSGDPTVGAVTRYFTINLKYQNMQPTVIAGGEYNSVDEGVINSTTIFPNMGITAFTVTFNQ